MTNILYVDDEELNLQLLKINLRKDYNVLTANSATDGLRILESNSEIVIVISDMRMPVMNGLEFIKLAKEKYPNIFYYILTGYDLTDEIQEAIESKLIKKYFRKPFNINDIKNTIEQALKI